MYPKTLKVQNPLFFMRIRYSFSSRRTRRLDKVRKQKQKYPDIVTKIVAVSDIVLEILDARFVDETRNKELEKEIEKQGKKVIYVLNKADLVDKKLEEKMRRELSPYVFVSCTNRVGIKSLRNLIKKVAKTVEKREKRELMKGNVVDGEEGKIKVGIVGYPNVGKSSLLNLLVGKSSAGVGSDAGFTKGIQKIKLSDDILLLDSPGVIPDDRYSETDKVKLAEHTILGGRSFSQVKEPDMVVANLMLKYPGVLEKYYGIKAKGDSEELIEKLGKKKGALKKKDMVDEDKVARDILKDWQKGEIKV
jgi:ribosome biogenesis GTPase A